MAVTGLVWVGYLVLHVAGNLQAFVGQAKINAYSALLHGPAVELLWLVRAVLLVSLVLHVTMAFQLTRAAHASRPDGARGGPRPVWKVGKAGRADGGIRDQVAGCGGGGGEGVGEEEGPLVCRVRSSHGVPDRVPRVPGSP